MREIIHTQLLPWETIAIAFGDLTLQAVNVWTSNGWGKAFTTRRFAYLTVTFMAVATCMAGLALAGPVLLFGKTECVHTINNQAKN